VVGADVRTPLLEDALDVGTGVGVSQTGRQSGPVVVGRGEVDAGEAHRLEVNDER